MAGIAHADVARSIHGPFWERNVGCDVVVPSGAWNGHDVVVVPAVMLVDDGLESRLAAAADRGAHVVVTFASGIADLDDHVVPGGYPGALRDLLGIVSEEFTPPRAGQAIHLDNGMVGDRWFEDVRTTDAEVDASAVDGPRPGGPALTRATRGDGAAWYVATWLDDEGWGRLADDLLSATGIPPVADVDRRLEAVPPVRGARVVAVPAQPRRRAPDRPWPPRTRGARRHPVDGDLTLGGRRPHRRPRDLTTHSPTIECAPYHGMSR